MRSLSRVLGGPGSDALLASFAAGLYLAIFFTVNNLTMLQGGGILLLFAILVLPLTLAAGLVYYPLHLAGKGEWAATVVAFGISVFLLFMLRPTLLDFDVTGDFIRGLTAGRGSLANTLVIAVPAAVLTLVFRRRLREYAAILGVMALGALLMAAVRTGDGRGATWAGEGLGPELQRVTLAETPNVYFVLADGYGSLAYMKEHDIDVSDLTEFLARQDFRLYEDTYSNYQPTTSAMPAFLNMDHHYYSVTGHQVNFTEVDKASRQIIGGDNNLSKILRSNGYSIQYVHSGTYLLLQGCSADDCFPRIDGLAGARIILSQMLRMDLLSDEDKAWETRTPDEMRAQIAVLMDDDATAPRFQYIHAFGHPGHSSNAAKGKCDEIVETKKYAARVQSAGGFLRDRIGEIIARDPDAVIVLAGDHGPFISKRCSKNAYIDKASEYRDRAGALMAIRWSKSYDGRYDDRISSGVNLFRYVLASLAEDASPLLETAVPDDVFIRAGSRIFKVVEEGKPLDRPERVSRKKAAG